MKRMNISVKVNALTLERKLKGLPSRVRKAASYEAARYLVGTRTRGLKNYPKYKHIRRRKAYGKTFQSDKQRKYVMARIRDGSIAPGVPHRTGRMQRGWNVKRTRSGARITNSVDHAKWSFDNYSQANLNRLVGWRKTKEIEADNKRGMIRAADNAIKKMLPK